jgi:hypothetical protein
MNLVYAASALQHSPHTASFTASTSSNLFQRCCTARYHNLTCNCMCSAVPNMLQTIEPLPITMAAWRRSALLLSVAVLLTALMGTPAAGELLGMCK